MTYQNPEYEGWYVITACHVNYSPKNYDALVPALGKHASEALFRLHTRRLYKEQDDFRLFYCDQNGNVDLNHPVAPFFTFTEVYKVDLIDLNWDGDNPNVVGPRTRDLVKATYDRGSLWNEVPEQNPHYFLRFSMANNKFQHFDLSNETALFWVGEHQDDDSYVVPEGETRPTVFIKDTMVFSALVRYNDPDPAHYLGGFFFDDRDPDTTIDTFLAHQQNKARGIVDSAWKMTH